MTGDGEDHLRARWASEHYTAVVLEEAKRETRGGGFTAATKIGIGMVVLLVLVLAELGCSETATQTCMSTGSPAVGTDVAQPELVAIRRDAIEAAYPGFRDWETQESFAGKSVRIEVYGGDYYFAYIVHGSGLPIAEATCFRVDRVGRVFETGLFPDPVDSYAGYRNINPRNCRGIE